MPSRQRARRPAGSSTSPAGRSAAQDQAAARAPSRRTRSRATAWSAQCPRTCGNGREPRREQPLDLVLAAHVVGAGRLVPGGGAAHDEVAGRVAQQERQVRRAAPELPDLRRPGGQPRPARAARRRAAATSKASSTRTGPAAPIGHRRHSSRGHQRPQLETRPTSRRCTSSGPSASRRVRSARPQHRQRRVVADARAADAPGSPGRPPRAPSAARPP